MWWSPRTGRNTVRSCDDVGHNLVGIDFDAAIGIGLGIEQTAREVEVGNDINDVVQIIIGELLLELYGEEITDELNGFVIIEVVHEEFVVHIA